MAAPVVQTNLTIITEAESVTNWTALGGGASGLVQETDFFIQNANCVSKQCSAATKGQIFNFGSTIATGTNNHFLLWLYSTTPSALAELTGGGIRATLGTAATAYVDFYVNGKTPYIYGGWICYPIRYNNTANASLPNIRALTGAPGAAPQYFGGQVNCLATVKAANFGVDVIRYGDGIYMTQGDVTSPASFYTASLSNDSQNNRWGILQAQPGGYLWQGKFMIGQTTASVVTPTYFTGSNSTIIIPDTPHALSTFTEMLVDSTGTTFNLTNITFIALGTTTPGRLIFQARPSASSIDGCAFTDFGESRLTSSVSVNSTTWRRSNLVTQSGSTITLSTFDSCTGSAGAAALRSNAPSSITNCTFVKGAGTRHAMEITTAGSCTFVGHKFTGYVAGTGSSSTGNEVVYNNSGGSVTISVTSGDPPSYRNGAGATTSVITGQRTLTLSGLVSGSEVRIYPSGSTSQLTGIETSDTTFAYTYSYAPSTNVNIVIFSLNYLPIFLAYTLLDSDTTLPVQQVTDRQYYNPP